jgi:uncharacterized membrane protein HdeD (DUF308 family)
MTSPHEARPAQQGQPGSAATGSPPGTGVPQQATPSSAAGESATEYVTIGRPERAMPVPIDVFAEARSVWPAFLAAGLGCLAVGVILLVWPKATLTVAAILIGASLIVAGLLGVIHGFTTRQASSGRRAGNVVIGLLAIIVGLYCIRHYHITITVLAIIVGLIWAMHGIAQIAAGLIGGRDLGGGLAVLAGVLSLAAGLIVLFWPTISLTVLVVVMGIWLIVYGILTVITAYLMRRAGKAEATGEPGRFAAA